MTVTEWITATEYTREVWSPSRLVPGLHVHAGTHLTCPRCRSALGVTEHGERVTCTGCGLAVTRYGNGLKLEEEIER